MRRALKPLWLVIALLLGLGIVGTGLLAASIPERPFAKPDGPYRVGTQEFDWTDTSRTDPFAAAGDKPRRMTVQLWYPTDAEGAPAKYIQHPSEYGDRLAATLGRKVLTNAIAGAPLAASPAKFPVILYSHGFQATRWSATFVNEWLASHGYVVFAIEYLGPGSGTVRYLDGSKVPSGRLAAPKQTGDILADTATYERYLAQIMAIWRDDAHFGIGRIAALNTDSGPWQGRLDMARLGALGTSLGGALALELSAVDPRVTAAINYDGTLFGSIKTSGTSRPAMVLNHDLDSEINSVPPELRVAAGQAIARLKGDFDAASEHSTSDWYSVLIPHSEHIDFSDYPLFPPFSKRDAALIKLDRFHHIVRAYTLAFFDAYLKDKPSPLLAPGATPFPEAMMSARYRPAAAGPAPGDPAAPRR